MGNTELNHDNLQQYRQQIKGWGLALSDTADILIYGCDVAEGEKGKAFVSQFSRLTGADVAASDDLTGLSTLGGDWELEYSTGSIEAISLSSDYDGVLSTSMTIQDVYKEWQNNSLPSLDSIE